MDRLRAPLITAISSLMLVSCTTFQATENIQWARERNLPYAIVILPPERWARAANAQRFDPASLCVFVAPQNILVRSDVDLNACLNHELGHLREYQEGLPYHSKYGW
jgi:hypothetical protein